MPCAARTIIFKRESLNYLIASFTRCTLFFQKSLFSITDLFAVLYLQVVCNEDKLCVVTMKRATDICVAWLVYICTYFMLIATLNQNKRTRSLYLGDAQIIRRSFQVLLCPIKQKWYQLYSRFKTLNYFNINDLLYCNTK